MYEHRQQKLLPRPDFYRRLAAHGGLSVAIVGVSLTVGIIGYHSFGGLSWIDSLLNSAMILGGEGPVDRMESASAKIFASLFALYSGLVLLVAVGIVFSPVLHRILHSFHLPDK